MKVMKQYKDESIGDAKCISEEEALKMLSVYYRDPMIALDASDKSHPAKTRSSYIWHEKEEVQ